MEEKLSLLDYLIGGKISCILPKDHIHDFTNRDLVIKTLSYLEIDPDEYQISIYNLMNKSQLDKVFMILYIKLTIDKIMFNGISLISVKSLIDIPSGTLLKIFDTCCRQSEKEIVELVKTQDYFKDAMKMYIELSSIKDLF